MTYEYITSYDSSNYGYPDGAKGQNKPSKIIVHHWGVDGLKFNNIVSWLCNPRAGVSAHYVVEAGRVACIVDESNAAWHAGNRTQNCTSVGIECRPEMSEGDLQTVAELIADIWKRYGKIDVVGHRDVASTACPGRYYNKLSKLKQMAEQIYSGNAPQRAQEAQIEVDGVWGRATTLATQKKLNTGYIDGMLSNQNRQLKEAYLWNAHASGWEFSGGTGGSNTVRAIQRLVGAATDGIMGKETVRAMQKFLGITADGIMGKETVKAWQRYLNSI